MIEQENELKSLLTEQPFEALRIQTCYLPRQGHWCERFCPCHRRYSCSVIDFKNNECHIYAGRFGQTTMNSLNIRLTIIRPLRTAYSAKPMKTNLLNVSTRTTFLQLHKRTACQRKSLFLSFMYSKFLQKRK